MKKKKIQLFLIHGGMTFKSKEDYIDFLKNRKIRIDKKKRWSAEYLDKKLGSLCQIIRPRMPLQDNAKYSEWKIHFERYFPYLKDNIILVGGSLGGIFLAKYLSENKFPKKILATYLISPPFDDTLCDEDLTGGFQLGKDLSMIQKNSPNLTLLFSKNDDCVPVEHAEKYEKKLGSAKIIVYKHIKGHFEISEFPEIVEFVKKDLKRL